MTACSGTGELSDRENEVVLNTSVGFCEDEVAESEDDMKGDEGRQENGKQRNVDDPERKMSEISKTAKAGTLKSHVIR